MLAAETEESGIQNTVPIRIVYDHNGIVAIGQPGKFDGKFGLAVNPLGSLHHGSLQETFS